MDLSQRQFSSRQLHFYHPLYLYGLPGLVVRWV